MSQLSDWRRRILKKSQEALAAELGYEKWQTYAAQELGKNPLDEDAKKKLRGKKYDYQGPWPQEEGQGAPAAEQLTRDDFLKAIGALETRLKDLEGVVEDLAEGLSAAIPSMPPRSRRVGRSG